MKDVTDVESLIKFLAAAHVSGCLHLQSIEMARGVVERPTRYGGAKNFEPSGYGTLKLEFSVCGQSMYDYENMKREAEEGLVETRQITEVKLLE